MAKFSSIKYTIRHQFFDTDIKHLNTLSYTVLVKDVTMLQIWQIKKSLKMRPFNSIVWKLPSVQKLAPKCIRVRGADFAGKDTELNSIPYQLAYKYNTTIKIILKFVYLLELKQIVYQKLIEVIFRTSGIEELVHSKPYSCEKKETQFQISFNRD